MLFWLTPVGVAWEEEYVGKGVGGRRGAAAPRQSDLVRVTDLTEHETQLNLRLNSM